MKRVAVTGLGVISPVGNDVPTFWNALCSGTCGIGPITKFDATDYPVKLAAEVRDFDPKQYMEKLDILHKALQAGGRENIRLAMKQVVPTYRDPEEVNCQVQNN